MRVLYVNHTSQVSGGERSLLDLLSALPAEVSAIVACPRGPLTEAVRQLGIETREIPGTAGSLRLHPWHTTRSLAELGRAAVRIRRIARSERVDLLHANSIRAALVAGACARLGGPPALAHVRDCLPVGALSRATQRLIAANTAAVLANSRYTATCFARAAGDDGVTRVVYSPVDLRRFDPARWDSGSARADLGVPDGAPVLAVLGQITPWKGQTDAVNIVSALADRHPDARLLIIGSPKFVSGATRYDNRTYMQQLEQLIESLGLRERVLLLGERDDVPELLLVVDVLLVPSWEEPLGRAVLEGMAMGLPVVATAIGGPAELIADGEDGRLLPPRRPDLWATVVDELLADGDLRSRMGERARPKVESGFGLERHVELVVGAYADVLAARST